MKKYQVVERYFEESRIVATFNSKEVANTIAIDLQKAYRKNGLLSHFFIVKEIIINE